MKEHIPPIYQHPYFFLALGIILRTLVALRDAKDKKIDFIFDRQTDLERRLNDIFYSRLKLIFPSLGECFHLDEKNVLPLQAADMSAWTAREYGGLIVRPTAIGPYLARVKLADVEIDRSTFSTFLRVQSETAESQFIALKGIISKIDPSV